MKRFIRIAGSNVAISRIGFGCARLFGGIEARTSRRLIETALSVGIRHFDTAPSYGDSELLLGEVLGGMVDVTIATKVGIPHVVNPQSNKAKIMYRKIVRPILSRMPSAKTRLLKAAKHNCEPFGYGNDSQSRLQLSRDMVLRSLELSLKRLKMNRVDIFMIHEPDQFEIDEKVSELFNSLRAEGTIGAFGLAYGRSVGAAPEFGTILQSCYSEKFLQKAELSRTRIMHGTLRCAWNSLDGAGRKGTASAYLEGILAGHPDLALIFSAGARHQIRSAVGTLLAR